jgi:hypothetical protein
MRKPAAVLIVLSLAVLALALVPAAGFAAKGGGGGAATGGKPSGGGGGHGGGGKPGGGSGSSSLMWAMVSDANGNGSPNWGDTITFTVSTSVANPYVTLTCNQNGALVYSASAGFYPEYLWPGARNMPLSSPSWMSGAASCTADLNNGAATLRFDVAA